ncbi:MAG: hypothetical protein IT380_20460 [Myxococcales bacterium]|nr:hypothetical protein [Myxococcales bacterium]
MRTLRPLMAAALVAGAVHAQDSAPPSGPAPAVAAEAAAAPASEAAPAAVPEVTQARPPPEEFAGCNQGPAHGLPEGPVALGYFEADMATGRRACPRTEVGLGGRFGASIDTPNFYGNLGINGLLFGSFAVRPDVELFATLEAANFTYTVNAVLTATQLTLGNFTLGGAYQVLNRGTVMGGVSARLLLPTSFETPGARAVGGELGFAASWRPKGWLEVHGYLGADVTSAFSRANPYTRFGGLLMAGAQLQPVSWFAFVLDLTGRLGEVSYFAPTAGLRFRIFKFGIEVGATLPLAGNDRHDFIMGARFSWRFD